MTHESNPSGIFTMASLMSAMFERGDGDLHLYSVRMMMAYMRVRDPRDGKLTSMWKLVSDPMPLSAAFRRAGFDLYEDRFGVRRIRQCEWRDNMDLNDALRAASPRARGFDQELSKSQQLTFA